MSQTGEQHTMDYRQEILTPLFNYISAGESFYVVGGASMGKTRLLDYLMKEEVQKHYLREEADRVWLVRVDMNRLAIRDKAWAFYELLLSSIVLEMTNHENLADLKQQFMDMNAKVIECQDLLFALRFFELAVNMLSQRHKIKLCFLLDEFDETYKNLSHETFSQLRGVRDANKYYVLYGVFLRELPEGLRPAFDNEDFYELLSRNMLGLGPYSKKDTLQIIQQLELRRDYSLTYVRRDQLYEASGGHIGLVQAFLGILIEDRQAVQKLDEPDWMEWLSQLPASIEECRKIWESLSPNERDGLLMFARGEYSLIPATTKKLILAKGLLCIVKNSPRFFSPVFENYIRSLG